MGWLAWGTCILEAFFIKNFSAFISCGYPARRKKLGRDRAVTIGIQMCDRGGPGWLGHPRFLQFGEGVVSEKCEEKEA